MTDGEQIRQLLATYAHRLDDRDAEGYSQVFSHDATLVRARGISTGREAIKQSIQEIFAEYSVDKLTKHLCASSIILIAGATAQATSDVVGYERIGSGPWQVVSVGRYVDRLVREDDKWLLSKRRTVAS
jgi:uncharacterized protein (TIGR02246 family)